MLYVTFDISLRDSVYVYKCLPLYFHALQYNAMHSVFIKIITRRRRCPPFPVPLVLGDEAPKVQISSSSHASF